MSATVPPALQQDTPEARVLKQKIWDACNKHNQHFIGALVGPEGSGKSHTALKIGEVVDPSFTAERVMFDPAAFLKRLKEWKENGETKGKVVVGDEAGVGIGVRTWYDEDQIKFNQVLQVIRDENMAILFTVPRLSELDSQTRGRVRGFMEMTDLNAGEWAKFKFLNWKPSRDERDKIYRNYPELRFNGYKRTIRRLCVSPPSEDLVREYQKRKSEFQSELYQEALDKMEDDVDDAMTVKEVAVEIADSKLGNYVSRHSQNHNPYINDKIIRADYGISQNDAKTVKSLLEQQFSQNDLEEYV